jgi:hypothetical protein
MKKLLVLLIVFMVSQLNAQNIDRYLELLRTDLKAQKTAIITEAMKFTPEESEKFWPLYREYDLEMTKIEDGILKLIKEYYDNYETMVDKRARDLMNTFLDLSQDKVKLRKKYFKKFDKILGATKAARFMQVDNQLDELISVQIATQVPLIRKPSDVIK